MNEVNATPHAELIAELMNPNAPKNEREHAAVREIERLREALAQLKGYTRKLFDQIEAKLRSKNT